MKKISVYAPATIANVGPGFDVLGMALENPGDIVKVNKITKGEIIISEITGEDIENIPYEVGKNTASVAATEMLNSIDADFGVDISLKKGYPSGCGMGSSAASSIGTLFAINNLLPLEERITEERIIEIAANAEKISSGVPHADNVAASLLGGITIAYPNSERENLGFINYKPPTNSGIIIVTPKNYKYTTKEAREVLKEGFNLNDIVHNSGSLAGLISALYTDDINLFGKMIQDKLVEPRRAKLIPNFNDIRNLLLDKKVLGVGIAGAGPSIFGLYNKKESNIDNLKESIVQELNKFDLDYQIFLTKPSIKGARII